MGIMLGRGAETLGNSFMQRLAMNEMLRKQEREKQQQAESIRNMFQMLGFQPPSGYMEPQQAGAVVNEFGARAREQKADTRFERQWNRDADWRTEDRTDRRGERAEDREWRNTERAEDREWRNTERAEDREFDKEMYQARRGDEVSDIESDREWQESLVRLRKALDTPRVGDYGQFVFDEAKKILDTQGFDAFSAAIGEGKKGPGEIARLMQELDDDEYRMVAQKLNMLERQVRPIAPQVGSGPGFLGRLFGGGGEDGGTEKPGYFKEGGTGIPGMLGDWYGPQYKATGRALQALPGALNAAQRGLRAGADRAFPQVGQVERGIGSGYQNVAGDTIASLRSKLNPDGQRMLDFLLYGNNPLNATGQNAIQNLMRNTQNADVRLNSLLNEGR
jgi:hypothetical protein